MGHRQRFTKQEKTDFQPGVKIEWQNGSHWHEGVILTAPKRDGHGYWAMGVRHTGRRTATLSPGQYITGTPGKVRMPVPAS